MGAVTDDTRRVPEDPRDDAAVFARLLDLLARGAPAEALARAAAGDRDPRVDRALAAALGVRRTLDEHHRREAELAALFDTAGDLARLRDPAAVLRAIVRRARLLLRADVAYLTLLDPALGDTFMRVTDGSVSARFQQLRLGMGEGLGGLVAQTARPHHTRDYPADTRFRHTDAIDAGVGEEGLRGILGVPLRVGEDLIGVLYAADRTPREFAPDAVALLSSLADHAAIAIDSARRLEETRTAGETAHAHSEALRRAAEAHDRLTGLVLRGAELTEVAAEIAALLDGGLLVHDTDGTELARVAADPTPPPARGLAAARAAGRAAPVDGTWICAVTAGSEPLGSITLTGRPELPSFDRRLFERAGLVTALLLLLRRTVAEAEDRVRGELLDELLDELLAPEHLVPEDPDRAGRLAAATRRALRLGVRLADPQRVLVLHAEPGAQRRLREEAARRARLLDGLSGPRRGHVVLVVPVGAGAPAPRDLARDLTRALGTPVTVGAAEPLPGERPGARALPGAHADALRCLRALHALGRAGDGATLPELGFLGLLLGEGRDVSGYVRRVLGPVLDYDARRGTELVRTLRAYYAAGGSHTRAKDTLHVHVNTVVQRLDRVARLLGPDWNAAERAVENQLALRLHLLAEDGGP
ncbi:helix-turn-helix domain-containing protein (plasmid) [Streptomyces sp. BI20]|uniref:helix-turn-helix domain-containing protein n=1 Tax=Streptomyces sp. BI20 TaxID=3403460 RepID=UPI003C72D9F0